MAQRQRVRLQFLPSLGIERLSVQIGSGSTTFTSSIYFFCIIIIATFLRIIRMRRERVNITFFLPENFRSDGCPGLMPSLRVSAEFNFILLREMDQDDCVSWQFMQILTATGVLRQGRMSLSWKNNMNSISILSRYYFDIQQEHSCPN